MTSGAGMRESSLREKLTVESCADAVDWLRGRRGGWSSTMAGGSRCGGSMVTGGSMTGAGGSSARVRDYLEYFLIEGEFLDRFIQGKTDYILFLVPNINCARHHAALAHDLPSGAWTLSSMHLSGVQFSRNYDRILFEGGKEVYTILFFPDFSFRPQGFLSFVVAFTHLGVVPPVAPPLLGGLLFPAPAGQGRHRHPSGTW